MTVREAFRRERARLWNEDLHFAASLWTIASNLDEMSAVFEVRFGGLRHSFVPDYETYQRHYLAFERARLMLREAIDWVVWREAPSCASPPAYVNERWWRNYSANPTSTPRD